jgi:glutamyl-tRNA reductase
VERAQALAARLGGEAIALGDLPQYLARADIVISSTASTLPILGKGAVESALKARRHKPMFMVDIAVPRDIEPEVGDLDDVYLYTIDDLRQVVAENLKSREQAAREAEHLIEGQAAAFMRWVRSLEAVPTIRALREAVAAMERAERERALALIAAGREPREVIEALARRLAAKFTHRPMRALRLADSEGNRALLEAARRLFQLSDE